MTIRFFALLFTSASFPLISFIGISQTWKKDFEKQGNLIALAWNEDSVHNYQFSLLRDLRFAYTIIENGSTESVKTYYGRCIKYTTDTLFLKYNKNVHPIGMVRYLIQVAGGHYFIQKFTDTPKLIFLRLQQMGQRI